MTVALSNKGTVGSATSIKSMDEPLKQLVIKTQGCVSQTERHHSLLTQLVDEILRSRSICRPIKGQSLCGIYQEIYQAVHHELWSDLNQSLSRYNPQKIPVREWANGLRTRAFRVVLTHERLQKLALVAQNYPPQSDTRQYALRELVEAIRCSGKLCCPHRGRFSPELHKMLYDEALNQTLVYVCQKIHLYDPTRGGKFMTWVNFRLDKQVLDCYRQFNSPQTQTFSSLEDLEYVMETQQPQTATPTLSAEVREFLEEDPENILKKEHIRGRPDVNFQVIALMLIAEKSWKEISAELNVSMGTVSSFFGRTSRKLAPKFKEYF